jgi:hypothetical protein
MRRSYIPWHFLPAALGRGLLDRGGASCRFLSRRRRHNKIPVRSRRMKKSVGEFHLYGDASS